MVAPKRTIAERFANRQELTPRDRQVQFTRHDAEAMMRAGIIPEDASTELLNGSVMLKDRSALKEDPMTIGTDHSVCVENFSDLRSVLNNAARHVKSQQPLVCSNTHLPEPDFMVLRGARKDYTDHPTAADAFCVVEVADSSYERDAGLKLVAYARAGIQQYIIINLRNRTAEVYMNPNQNDGTYPPPQIVSAAGELSIRVSVDEEFAVSLATLLP